MTRIPPHRRAAAALALLAAVVSAGAAHANEPKPIPGRDPGGVAVALVGNGIDYTAATLSGRLARDGEGEPIAWDFTDNDPRPYAAAGDGAAAALAAAAPSARLVAVKIDPSSREPHAAAIGFVRRTPARVALLDTAAPGARDWALVERAAILTPQILFIVPVADAAALPAAHEASPAPAKDAAPRPANLLVVAAAAAELPAGAGTADIALAVAATPADLAPARRAALRAAALAADAAARDQKADGAALKAKLMALARKPVDGGEASRAASGVIDADAFVK